MTYMTFFKDEEAEESVEQLQPVPDEGHVDNGVRPIQPPSDIPIASELTIELPNSDHVYCRQVVSNALSAGSGYVVKVFSKDEY